MKKAREVLLTPGVYDGSSADEWTERWYNLARECIVLALRDLRRVEYRDGAIAWFNARDQEVFGYGWCLVGTGWNPNLVRKMINRSLAMEMRKEKKKYVRKGENNEK